MHNLTADKADSKTARASRQPFGATVDRDASDEQPLNEAFYDATTGLPSRALFMDRLKHALERAERPGSPSFSVLVVDLDEFIALNTRLGQTAGDELLRDIGTCLNDCLRPGDTVGRLGGDTFAILLENVTATASLAQVAHRLFETLSSLTENVTASIGMVTANGHSDMTAETLLRDAGTALQRAKAQGKGRYTMFDSSLD